MSAKGRLDETRLVSLEQRLTDHESRCEERLGEIKTFAGSTLRAVESLKGRFWAITFSLLAWALAQLWTGSQARVAHIEATRPALVQEAVDVAAG